MDLWLKGYGDLALIPACAGEPSQWRITAAAPGVYPRVCGGTDYIRHMRICRHIFRPNSDKFRKLVWPRKRGSGCGIVRRYAEPRSTHDHDSYMTILTETGHQNKVRASGVAYPDLERKISWLDGPDVSEAAVWSRSSGGVLLEVERRPVGWSWTVYGWLGVRLASGHAERVRGNRLRRFPLNDYSGSIPACAGEPGAGNRTRRRRRVYPRVCGGTSQAAAPGQV